MAPKKLTKQEKTTRERELATATFYGLTARQEHHAKAWALRCAELQKGLSKTAIRRAQRDAHMRAADAPPGYAVMTESIGIFDDICERLSIPKADAETLWGAVAKVCMFELGARAGTFFEAADSFGLVRTPGAPRSIEVVSVTPPLGAARCGNPNCRNCNPRSAEELN
jgi:hypothetical protein